MGRGEDCVENFVHYIENEVKRLYKLFPQQPMMELTDVLKREHYDAKTCHICLKSFGDAENRKSEITITIRGYIEVLLIITAT